MTDSFVTQCPHCQTSFRVSHAQLSVARGAVRCGSCLQVFNAARQLLEQSPGNPSVVPAEPPLAQPEQPPLAPIASPEKHWNAPEVDLDSLDLDQELARLEEQEIRSTTELGRGLRTQHDLLSARRDSANEDAPWSGSLYSDSPAERLAADLDTEPKATLHEPADAAKAQRTEPSLSLLPTDLDEEPPLAAHQRKPEPVQERLVADDSDDDLPAERSQHGRGEPGVHNEVLMDLMDDPIPLDWQKRRSPWGRRLLWSLLILLGVAALAAQYVWYHFDELARQDQYRPWFQQLCPELGCKVPPRVDIEHIKSSNLVVRSHPDFKAALVVDAILYNRAPFSQPFPLLELRFADLNGHLIASRRFKPSEYLSGDLAGQSEMPPQTPIHIALDILDPGPNAVNYSLSFHSPE